MMLFKLAVKNIRKSIKDYAIYFSTLVLGIAVFYVFNAMEASTAIVQLSTYQNQLIELMSESLSYISVFVSFVLGFLIIYASRFLMRRRKKEFAIYMTLGMGKRSIAKILLSETFLIGILSLVVGLILGIGVSQFMSILVAKLFEVDMSAYQFTFSMEALLKTLLYFSIIYVIVMVFSTISISKGKLITLLNANRQNEKIKVKRTWISIILFIASIATLAYAYHMVTGNGYEVQMNEVGIAILLGCIGTFLFFYSLAGFALQILQFNKRFYYRNLNMFVVRQMDSKISTTVFSMTIICIMLFLTICILSSGISINQSLTQEVKRLTPVDLQVSKMTSIYQDPTTAPVVSEEPMSTEEEKMHSYFKTSLLNDLKELGFDSDKYLKDSLELDIYRTPEMSYNTLFANNLEMIKKEFPMLYMESEIEMMRISDYNALAKLYHFDAISLSNDEFFILANFDGMIPVLNRYMQDVSVVVNKKQYQPKYKECKEGFVYLSASPTNTGIIVVPDEALSLDMYRTKVLVANYNANDEDAKQAIEKNLLSIGENQIELVNERYVGMGINTKISIYESSVGLGAIVTFIGLYLGVIFLISSAAILALKELSESSDNKQRYTILRKIGVNEKMINHALFAQIIFFFLLPISLAIVHSIFGMKFAEMLLTMFGKGDMLASATLSGLFILFIYGGYLLITYFCSKNIIKEN